MIDKRNSIVREIVHKQEEDDREKAGRHKTFKKWQKPNVTLHNLVADKTMASIKIQKDVTCANTKQFKKIILQTHTQRKPK